MHFSILHISDLHRDPNDEVDNPGILNSLERDFGQHSRQHPEIIRPALAIVSGDLVYGVKPNAANATTELNRQYAQAEQFLVGLADRFFDGNRERIVILPGNHDVCYADVMGSVQKVEIPSDQGEKVKLVAELFKPQSRLRWSWNELCFFRIIDEKRYNSRLHHFATTYENFYEGRRSFPLTPEQQHDVFDFPNLGFSVVALNSCYNNDPLHRAGAFHPTSVTEVCRAICDTRRTGWLIAGAWHHNLFGGPFQDDYLDIEVMQVFIDAGVSLGFHGHQHLTECVEEHYRIGPSARKMTIISASTLCAGPSNLSPGVPRGYNVVELDTQQWSGRVHQRQMVNRLFNLPVWGPGRFNATNRSYIDFNLCKPRGSRPLRLDVQLTLERADKLLGSGQWGEAADMLDQVKDTLLARPLLVKALRELGDDRRTIATLWPPQTNGETVTIGGAILDGGTREDAETFVGLELVSGSTDASVREISRRVRERWLR